MCDLVNTSVITTSLKGSTKTIAQVDSFSTQVSAADDNQNADVVGVSQIVRSFNAKKVDGSTCSCGITVPSRNTPSIVKNSTLSAPYPAFISVLIRTKPTSAEWVKIVVGYGSSPTVLGSSFLRTAQIVVLEKSKEDEHEIIVTKELYSVLLLSNLELTPSAKLTTAPRTRKGGNLVADLSGAVVQIQDVAMLHTSQQAERSRS